MNVCDRGRSTLQFRLRTLLLALVVLSLPLGWLGMVLQLAREERLILRRLERWDPSVEYRTGLMGRYVTRLSLRNRSDSAIDGALAHLKDFTRLELLDLAHTRVTDAGLSHLRGISALKQLQLRGTGITDSGLGYLTELDDLTFLNITDTNVSDGGLYKLRLTLPHCVVVPPDPERVQPCEHLYKIRTDETGRTLEQIAVANGQIWFEDPSEAYRENPDAVAPVPTRGQWLDAENSVKRIFFSPQSPRVLSGLHCFRELKTLILCEDVVTDESLSNLRPLEGLEALTIHYSSRFTGEGIKHLRQQPRLRHLGLSFLKSLDGQQLAHLAGLEHLESLAIMRGPIDDVVLEQVGAVRGLVSLDLGDSGHENVRCRSLKALSSLSNLQNLQLWGFRVESSEYRHLESLSNLKSLRVEDGYLDDSAMREFGELKQLTDLSLEGKGITDAGLQYLKHLQDLSSLRIEWTNIGGDGLVHLYGLANLRHVNVVGASMDSKRGLERALPNCEVH